MQDAGVIDECCIERLDQGKFSQINQAIDADSRCPGVDVRAFDKKNADPIDPVTVHALRRWMSGGYACLYAELMHLDFKRTAAEFEDSEAETEQVGKGRAFERGLLHLSKPARYPAIERIVVPTLKMRLCGKRNEAALGKTQDSVTPTPLASAICHIVVGLKPIPARSKFGPSSSIEWSEQSARRFSRGGCPAERSDLGNQIVQTVSQSCRSWR